MDVLIHISQQLSNSTTPAFVPATFQVSPTANVVNAFFFLSLAFVLIDAFLAMVVKGWLQEFDRGWRMYNVAHLRAQKRERRLQELERWKLHELVALLPILIQVSLMLFCIGLIVLIFPLHLPSAILSILACASVGGFYSFSTCVSIANKYSPFSSPVSRLLARGLADLRTWPLSIARNTQHIASVMRFHNSPPLPPHDQQAGRDTSDEAIPSNNGVAKPSQAHNSESVEKSKVVPRSRSDIDPRTHVHVLERLVSTTAEAVENIPVFLELLDQPVKDTTLRPLNVEKWKVLFHTTFGLLREQPTFPVSAACTLARTMVICYNRETADQQLGDTLQYHLGTREPDENGPRRPFSLLLSSYLSFWIGHSRRHDLFETIALLEPSGASDAELLWMVNTFHMNMRSEGYLDDYYKFCVAVLTYVSSTEQCKRSQVPLTAAVIYALHTIRSALGQGGINSTAGLYILPRTASASESVLMTFCQVDGIDALDLWSEECIQFVKDLFQWSWPPICHHDFELSLIAALYIDSTKQAHARSTFARLLKYTTIKDANFIYSGAYDDRKLAAYWYMAVSKNALDQDRFPLATLYDVIVSVIERSTSQLSGVRILDIAVKCVHKTASPSSDWLQKRSSKLKIIAPGQRYGIHSFEVDHWVLLHLDTLLSPQPYLLPDEVKNLKWSDTPDKVFIAGARLDLYDSLANAQYERAQGPRPDPDLLRLFLWSKDYAVCTRAFKWCIDLYLISPPDILGDADSTRVFIPRAMGSHWVEHFIQVLCEGDHLTGAPSMFLMSHLVPKLTMLPPSWCCDFASAFLFFIVRPLDTIDELPIYQLLALNMSTIEEWEALFSFLGTLLGLTKSSLTWTRLTSFKTWVDEFPVNWDRGTQILTAVKQQLTEETLGFFAELPMVDE
jgi:hypothetical protein